MVEKIAEVDGLLIHSV